jgi:thymidine kinase
MFAGKSTALLQFIEAAEESQQKVLVVTSALDNRCGPEAKVISTHNGARREAVAVHRLLDIGGSSSMRRLYADSDVVAIDESQFFDDLQPFVLDAVEQHGKIVIAAGLNGDYTRSFFGDLVKLVPYADSVSFLTARCSFCERPAPFTLRIVASDQQVLVGGGDAYRPVCRDHYHELGLDVRASAT